jgi:hypothetical protein
MGIIMMLSELRLLLHAPQIVADPCYQTHPTVLGGTFQPLTTIFFSITNV